MGKIWDRTWRDTTFVHSVDRGNSGSFLRLVCWPAGSGFDSQTKQTNHISVNAKVIHLFGFSAAKAQLIIECVRGTFFFAFPVRVFPGSRVRKNTVDKVYAQLSAFFFSLSFLGTNIFNKNKPTDLGKVKTIINAPLNFITKKQQDFE